MSTVATSSAATLSICLMAIMLSACGGEGDANSPPAVTPSVEPTDSTETEVSSETVTSPTSLYPEPTQDVPDAATLGFYDYNAAGDDREVRADLEGSFQAMIQFGQNHVVDPQGNEAKNMPRLTANKDALLLVTPTTQMGDLTQLTAEIYHHARYCARRV